jgi:4-hydroxy-tetrahydrodipicolinate reductase
MTQGADVVVAKSMAQCLDALPEPPHVVYHMTESILSKIEGQMTDILKRGINLISASEGMFHPTLRFPDVAGRLDAVAKANGVSITGVGINPGYIFDSVPLMIARCTSGVTGVNIRRVIEVTGTGPGDIDHVGFQLMPDEFHKRIKSGRIVGHMGLPDTIAAVAERLNLKIDRIEEAWETATATFPVDSGVKELGMIEPGRVIGITQTGRGMLGDKAVVSMSLLMYYNPKKHGLEEADEIEIVGSHHIRVSFRPAAVSIFGAGNMIVNATHDVIAAPPGLVNVLDFSIAGVERGGYRYVLDRSKASDRYVTPVTAHPLG